MKKEKLLIVSYKIPYPLSQGGSIAQFFFLEHLATIYDISFCTITNSQFQKTSLEGLKNAIPNLKVYSFEHIDNVTFKSSLVAKFVAFGTVLIKNTRFFIGKCLGKVQFSSEFNNIDVSFGYLEEEFVLFLKTILKENDFEFIQLEFFETISLLPILPKKSKKIVVHHEIRSKRNSLISMPNIEFKNYIVETTKIIENTFLNFADSVIVFNEKDKEYLSELKTKVYVSPFGIPRQLIEKREVSTFFNKFLFLGSENHYPNKEGLQWFLDQIYIPNSKVINWPIYITGTWSENFKKKYKQHESIIFIGFIPDLKECYDHSIMLTPILSGSGIRTKILQSFANKITVMATKFASEGLFENSDTPNHLIHFDSEMDFLLKFEKMRNDMSYLTSIAENGFQYFSNFFNRDDLVQKRVDVYNDLNY